MGGFRYTLRSAACVAFLAAGSASAQPYFDAPWRAFDAANYEIGAETGHCLKVGDLNGDGLADAVVGQGGISPPGLPAGQDGVRVFLNRGDAGGPARFR